MQLCLTSINLGPQFCVPSGLDWLPTTKQPQNCHVLEPLNSFYPIKFLSFLSLFIYNIAVSTCLGVFDTASLEGATSELWLLQNDSESSAFY
jgi:hypothetical protein